MKKIIRFIKDVIYEQKWLRTKPCAACKYFDYYMGSAGICTAKSGCPTTRMKDYFEYCDCGKFKRKRKG
jgi:hypothetical protein